MSPVASRSLFQESQTKDLIKRHVQPYVFRVFHSSVGTRSVRTSLKIGILLELRTRVRVKFR